MGDRDGFPRSFENRLASRYFSTRRLTKVTTVRAVTSISSHITIVGPNIVDPFHNSRRHRISGGVQLPAPPDIYVADAFLYGNLGGRCSIPLFRPSNHLKSFRASTRAEVSECRLRRMNTMNGRQLRSQMSTAPAWPSLGCKSPGFSREKPPSRYRRSVAAASRGPRRGSFDHRRQF